MAYCMSLFGESVGLPAVNMYVVSANRRLQSPRAEFVCTLLGEFSETVALLAVVYRFAGSREPDDLALESVNAGAFSVKPTRDQQCLKTDQLAMVVSRTPPAAATSVDRFPVIGFIPLVRRWVFAWLPV